MDEITEPDRSRDLGAGSMLTRFAQILVPDLDARALEVLERGAVKRRYMSREMVYFQGDPPDGVHVVAHGCAILEWRAPNDYLVGFRVASSGDSFGLRSYCAQEPRSTTARAITETLTIYLPRTVLERAAVLDARIYRGFAWMVARDTGPKLSKVSRNGRVSVAVRLAFVLLQLAHRLPVSTANGSERVEFPLQQKDLANLLDVSQETVSRTLRDFESRKLACIERRPRQLVIQDRAGLVAVAEDYLD